MHYCGAVSLLVGVLVASAQASRSVLGTNAFDNPNPTQDRGKPGFIYAVYLESRHDPGATTAAHCTISKLPKYVTHLLLSSMRPDTTYAGNVTFNGTGLEFSSDADVIKGAIAMLKEKNPDTKVLVSVGGTLYKNWHALNAEAVAHFVKDFGLDGVVIDYEVVAPTCYVDVDGSMQCYENEEHLPAIEALREALPRPYILANAAMNVGAHGEGDSADAQRPLPHAEHSVMALRELGKDLDLLLLMDYGAGELPDSTQALQAFSNYYEGDILLGMKVAPSTTNAAIDRLTDHVSQKKIAGLVLEDSARQQANPKLPASSQIFQRICKRLDLEDCGTPLVL